jgi:hypothetical protein
MGDGQDAGGERGALAGADGVVGDAGGVYHMGGGEAARLRGGLGKLSGWGVSQGSSVGPGGTETGGGGSIGVDGSVGCTAGVWDMGNAGGVGNNDVAAVVGSGCGMRGWGSSWGELDGVGDFLDRR